MLFGPFFHWIRTKIYLQNQRVWWIAERKCDWYSKVAKIMFQWYVIISGYVDNISFVAVFNLSIQCSQIIWKLLSGLHTNHSNCVVIIGIPDCNGYRALCWKILLGYLGCKTQDWPNILQKKRQLYKQFISKLRCKVKKKIIIRLKV